MEEVLSQSWNRLHRKCRNSRSSMRTTDNWKWGAEEDQYPVTFPCVLIGNTSSDWNDLGYGVQKSESMLTVRLAIDCYDDTSYASGTYDKVRERQQLAEKLYKSLQCLQCTDNASPLVREKSRSYAMPHYVKVYEMTFSFTLHDESAMPSSYGE